MSEQWRALAEQLQDVDESQADLLDLELNSCLLAIIRFLVEKDRRNPTIKTEGRPLSFHPVCDARRNTQ